MLEKFEREREVNNLEGFTLLIEIYRDFTFQSLLEKLDMNEKPKN